MKTGVELIAQEREEQIQKHGFTGYHHLCHPEWYEKGQLLHAATALMSYDKDNVFTNLGRTMVPRNWEETWWHRLCDKPKFERIVIAGALIAAEIDRLQACDPHLESLTIEAAQNDSPI